MLSFDVIPGQTVITKAIDRRTGKPIQGLIIRKGPKNAKIKNSAGEVFPVPYEYIVAVNETEGIKPIVEVLDLPTAKAGDIIVLKNKSEFRVLRVNRTRYVGVRIPDGAEYSIPFNLVQEVKNPKNEAEAWLLKKGLSQKDVEQFKKLFLS